MATTPGLSSPAPQGAASSPRSGTASPGSPTSAPNPENVGVLEADDTLNADDGDSALGFPTDASDTTSIRSFITRYREENGRTYHAYKSGGDYNYLQHNLFLMTLGNKLWACPHINEQELKRVLDAGTGTGIWAMEFADEHPSTKVVGTDLSPIQPSMVAPNVEFFVDDLEQEWTFVEKFDFIYARMMTGSIKNWPRFFEQAYAYVLISLLGVRLIRAYLEVADAMFPVACDDGSFPEDSALQKWAKLVVKASSMIGAPINSALQYKQQMMDAGFLDVHQVEYKWPINAWAKDTKHKQLGAWSLINNLQGVAAFSYMLFTAVLGFSKEEIEVMLVDVRKDIKNTNYHGYWPVYMVYGRKPE
ncbi:hypothetical protein N0V88_005457 [Collariella sp. IMI 366227]|nr:hypothetical protein N0V88_005457 [Collariella sp. IMI 366227]